MWKQGEVLYLDYAASTPLRPGALKVLETSIREDFANPSSAHQLGRGLQHRIELCREKFLKFLGAGKNDRFIFTGSATESNNTIVEGIDLNPGDSVVVSFADHPSVTAPLTRLIKRGIQVKELPLREDGTPDEPAFFKLLDGTVRLVILTQINNQSGAIVDIGRLSGEIKEIAPGAHIHVDAAQGFGKLFFSLQEKHIESLSISSHKMGGPKGIAGLYLRSGITLSPLLYGGGQEDGIRSSTLAAPLIFSFCEAAVEAMDTIDLSWERVKLINRLAQERLKEKIDTIGFPFVKSGSPYILTLILPGIASDIIIRHLEQEGIMISSTSACSSRIKGTNPVFTALHLPANEHKNVLRVSFSHETTEAEVIRFSDTIAAIYTKLKKYIKH